MHSQVFITASGGFFLIELVVVIAILGILAALAIPKFSGVQGSANEKGAMATVSSIQKAAEIVAAEKNILIANVAVGDIYTALGITDFATDYNNKPKGATYTWDAPNAKVTGIAKVGPLFPSGAFTYAEMITATATAD